MSDERSRGDYDSRLNIKKIQDDIKELAEASENAYTGDIELTDGTITVEKGLITGWTPAG